jgi:hypothetical protein
VGAVVVRRRRKVALFPLLVTVGVVLLTVAVTYANHRFRSPVEIVLAVLAAMALDAGGVSVAQRICSRRTRGAADVDSAAARGIETTVDPVHHAGAIA